MTTYLVMYGGIALIVSIVVFLDMLGRRQERRRDHKP
jgi:hypothetical protein